MSKANEYRRESARIIRVARENLEYLLAQAQQRPDPDPNEIDTLLLVIEYIDKCGTDATIRNHNIEELLIDVSRLRRQRDEAIDETEKRDSLIEQLQTELATYRAQYPKPTPKAPVRPQAEPPPPLEYFQRAFPFMTRPKKRDDTSSPKK